MAARPETMAVAGVAAAASVAAALARAGRSGEAIERETVAVSEIAAPTFDEGARAEHVRRRFVELGLAQVEHADDGNVYGLIPGATREDGTGLALYAHLDTVFAADVPVRVRRERDRLYGPGIGDNAAGVAGLLSAVAALQAEGVRPRRPVWCVATVGEEGLGDLRGARMATARLAPACAAVVAVEGSFFGRLSHVAVGSRRWRIRARAGGGHSWHDFGRPSAVHALVRAAAAITRVEVPSQPRTTYNIGTIRGGTGVNVIAEEAECLVDMRSIDPAQLERLAGRIRAAAESAAEDGVVIAIEEVGFRPAGSLPEGHALVRTCAAVLDHLGVQPVYAAASTDANIPLGRGIPAVTLGVTRGGGAHTRGEWIELRPMVRGVQQLVLVIAALADVTRDE